MKFPEEGGAETGVTKSGSIPDVEEVRRPQQTASNGVTADWKILYGFASHWANIGSATLLGDLRNQTAAVPHNEPDPARRGCLRVLLLILMVLIFMLAFIFMYTELVPNIYTSRIYLPRDESTVKSQLCNESHSYRIVFKNGEVTSGSSGLGFSDNVFSCPCMNTTMSWLGFTSFFVIGNCSVAEDANICSDSESIYLTRTFLTSTEDVRKFCVRSVSTWISTYTGTEPKYLVSEDLQNFCLGLICPLITESLDCTSTMEGILSEADQTSSFFESESLLPQGFFYFRSLQLINSYLRDQYSLLISSISPANREYDEIRLHLKCLKNFWSQGLDTFATNSTSEDADFLRRQPSPVKLHTRGFDDALPLQMYLILEPPGVIGMYLNWTEYYNLCAPVYCDVTYKTSWFHRIVTVCAQLGGLSTYVLYSFRLVLMPVLGYLLVLYFRGPTRASASEDPLNLEFPECRAGPSGQLPFSHTILNRTLTPLRFGFRSLCLIAGYLVRLTRKPPAALD